MATATRAADESLGPGATLDGRYVLTREIARGTFSVVFEARQRYLGRAVVVKVTPPGVPQRDSFGARLMREGRALDLVRHPGVVDVIDAGQCAAFGPYLVLEKLEGRTLDGILAARFRLAPDDAVRIVRELCDTLAHVHARGIVHRDLKPSNVFVSWNARGEECARLLDFGVSHVADELLDQGDGKLTIVGQVLGTPEYMPPEQLMAQHHLIDARSDVYSLGVTLWECLAGDIPVTGSYPEVLQFYAQNQRVPSLRTVAPHLPAPLIAAVDRALARNPHERYADMPAFARALDAALATAGCPTHLLGPPPAAAARTRASAAGGAAPMDGDAGAQRRKFPRAPYLAHVRLLREGGGVIDGRTEDVSEAGTLLVLPTACRKDERVQLRFALPTTGAVVTVRAVVRWVREGRGRVAAGLEFDGAPPEVSAAVARYVELMAAR